MKRLIRNACFIGLWLMALVLLWLVLRLESRLLEMERRYLEPKIMRPEPWRSPDGSLQRETED